METVAEDGTVTGTVKLQPDTFYHFVRTDDVHWADLQEIPAEEVTADVGEYYELYSTEKSAVTDWTEPVYRIREERDTWPYTIDGVNEEEIFGGIMYAG